MSTSDLALRAEGMISQFEDVEKTVFNKWWFTEVSNSVKNQQNLHSNNLQKIADSASERETKLKSLRKKIASEGKDLKQNLEAKKSELATVRNSADDLLRKREKLSESLQQVEKQNKEIAERLELQKKLSSIEQEELQRGSAYFHERLGLKLNKVKGGWMEVVFTQICKVDPARPFFFTCRVNESNLYDVGECDPPVKDFPSLAAKLNETNNLRSFIIEMRLKFKEYAETHQTSS